MSNSNQDWQLSKKDLQDRIIYMLEKKIRCDCSFLVGMKPNQQTIEAHKFILSTASPVFEVMFYGSLPEKNPIVIPDATPESFNALIKYIYKDNNEFTSLDSVFNIYQLAKKYMLPSLVDNCTKYLNNVVEYKNACKTYEFAQPYEEVELMKKCQSLFQQYTQNILTTTSFEEIDISTVFDIYDQEKINVTELFLFDLLPRIASSWKQDGDSKDSVRSPSIKDFLKKIRFLTLTGQQFAEGPGLSDFLTLEQKYAILINILTPKTTIQMPEGFSTNRNSRKYY